MIGNPAHKEQYPA